MPKHRNDFIMSSPNVSDPHVIHKRSRPHILLELDDSYHSVKMPEPQRDNLARLMSLLARNLTPRAIAILKKRPPERTDLTSQDDPDAPHP